jgi:pimeloyl-ACP methyl ester carboxylesterase
MRVLKKGVKWIVIILATLTVLLLLFAEGIDRYWGSERGALHLYSDVQQPKNIKRTRGGIRYIEIGNPTKPALLFIHGAPGSLFDGLALAKVDSIYEDFRLLIIDRPGYGGTRPHKPLPSIWQQAIRCSEVLEPETNKALVVGHSYGAPIGVIMGALYPDKVDRVVSLSGQFDPENEIVFPISYWIKPPLFKWILPRMIWTSNEEKMNHAKAQKDALNLYPLMQPEVLVVHGDQDNLVPYSNAAFIMRRLPESAKLWTLPGKDHPIHITDIDLVIESIYKQ